MNLWTWFKIAGTIIVVSALISTISARELFATLTMVSASTLACVFLLVPVYIFCRFQKWMFLVTQVTVIEKKQRWTCFQNYLNGMAIGLLTPGKVGELARIIGLAIDKRVAITLFIVDKLVELWCLIFFVAVSAFFSDSFARHISLSYHVTVLPIAVFFLFLFFYIINKLISKYFIFSIKILKNIILSLFCFVIFCFQMTLVLTNLYPEIPLSVFFDFPFVLFGNLIPVTIGGFGVREFIGIYVLQNYAVTREAIIASISLVAFIDLVIPSILGMIFTAGRLKKEIA